MSAMFHSNITAISAMARIWLDGILGGWWDPSDFSTMFQDSAGTIPVTAVGDFVGLIKDKSGRGRDLFNTTTAQRPTLQRDANGYYFLQFDGIDDNLYSTSGLWAGAQMMAAIAFKNLGSASGALFELTPDPDNINGSFNMYIASSGTAITANIRGSALPQNDGIFTIGPIGTLFTLTAMWDLTKTTNAEQKIVRVNGQFIPNPAPLKVTGNPGTFANAVLYLGRRGKPADPVNVAFYGGAIVGKSVTATESLVVEQFIGQKAGQVF